MRALAAISRLHLLEGRTDFPPAGPDGLRWEYARIDPVGHYWGDTTGVFQKPAGYRDLEVRPFREVAVWWANRVGDLSQVPGTDARHPGRRVEVLPSPPHAPVTLRVRRAARRWLPGLGRVVRRGRAVARRLR